MDEVTLAALIVVASLGACLVLLFRRIAQGRRGACLPVSSTTWDLVSHTDVATHVIFDPAAVPRLVRGGECRFLDEEALREDMDAGNLMLYSSASDGRLRLRLYVGERPPPEVEGLAVAGVKDRLLRVPSGTLWALGMEHLPISVEHTIPPVQDVTGMNGVGRFVRVPPGNYRVDGFALRHGPHPSDAVLVLQRLPDEADLSLLKGGAFGAAFVPGSSSAFPD